MDDEGTVDEFSLKLVEQLATVHPREAAFALRGHSAAEVAPVLSLLPPQASSAVLYALPNTTSDAVVMRASEEQIAEWLEYATIDAATALVRRISSRRWAKISEKCSPIALKRIEKILRHRLVGLIDPEPVVVSDESTIDEVIGELKEKKSGRAGNSREIYACDKSGVYVGVVDLVRALTVPPKARTRSLLTWIPPVPVASKPASLLQLDQWRAHTELAVVDADGKMVGVLTRARLLGHFQAGDSGQDEEEAPGWLAVCANLFADVLELLTSRRSAR